MEKQETVSQPKETIKKSGWHVEIDGLSAIMIVGVVGLFGYKIVKLMKK